jgi:hypothetical protein
MKTLILAMTFAQFVFVVGAQTKVPCYSGQAFPSCTPSERLAKTKMLAKAKSAAVIIEANRTIACGDGSDGTCIAVDSAAVVIIQKEVENSDLWQNLTKAEAKKADLLLKFNTRNRTSLQLCAYDADSNDLLWCDYRNPSIALDNDSSREIAHILDALRASQK